VQLERGPYRQLRFHALEALCDRMAAAGRFALAVRASLAGVEAEPVRESAQRALIRAHLTERNAGEAPWQHRSFQRLLMKELGLSPSDAIRSPLPQRLAVGAGCQRRT
jgi:DNA-binding SARP family transcriptional activator